ncbi:MAG: HigA family addiction module antitoxin [Gemmatimonadota bacterium]|jgi:addiction module HigA family antidote
MVRIPTNRTPTPPGEFLQEFLEDLGISQSELARRIQVPFQRVNDVVHGRRAMTPSTALRLSKFFGTTATFWMNAQIACDLYEAEREEGRILALIQPATASSR